jgi:diacylglycerol kinase family enzyme
MRATLIYNERSGTASEEVVVSGLAELGWEVERCPSREELDHYLRPGQLPDVVVVAGGDGTIGKVAKRLARTGIPMAVVPMGTANNVARSLGIGVDAAAAVRGLARPRLRSVDLGVARTKHEQEYFLEGFGLGVFAQLVGERARRKDKALRRAALLIADALDEYAPHHVELEVDGRDRSGHYVLLAVMNAQSLGPALGVAPDARCDDGELDVVLVDAEARDALAAELRRPNEGGEFVLPPLETARATQVRVAAAGRWAHIDDVARQLEGNVHIRVAGAAVKLLAPTTTRPP